MDQIARLSGARWAVLLSGFAGAPLSVAAAFGPADLRGLPFSGWEDWTPKAAELNLVGGEACSRYALTLTHKLHTGLLLLGATEPGWPNEGQRELIGALGEAILLAAQRDAFAAQAARQATQLAFVSELGRRATSRLDMPELYREITTIICERLGYEHTQLLLVDDRRGQVRLVYASGPAGPRLLQQGFHEAVGGKGIIGWVAGSGQPWCSNDVNADPYYESHALLVNTRAEMAVPLRIGPRIIGVLDVQSELQNAFSADDLLLLQTVADQIALTIEHSRLIAAANRERELAHTLRDVSGILCSSLELDHVLALILDQIGQVIPHTGIRIALTDSNATMRVVAAAGYPDNDAARRAVFNLERARIASRMIYEQQTIVIEDVREDPYWIWLPGIDQVRSWCGAPLVIKGRSIGTLSVDSLEPGFYTEEHAHILRVFADQAAVAIENARLYAAIKDVSAHLEQMVHERTAELQLARDALAGRAADLLALVRRVVEVQETERRRIANDLHDSVAQSILAVIYDLQVLRRRLGGDGGEAGLLLSDCQRCLDATLGDLKRTIYALRPRALDELGLIAALEQLADGLRASRGLRVQVKVVGEQRALPEAVELAIYRIVQEAAHNCVRHADAATLIITVEFRPSGVWVQVADDGRGFDPAGARHGLGLVSMRERAQAAGGDLHISSAPGAGAILTLILPCAVSSSTEGEHR